MKKFIFITLFLIVTSVVWGSYNPQQIITQGGMKKSLSSDLLQQDLLEEILIELKIMNLHFKEITEDKFTEIDIE